MNTYAHIYLPGGSLWDLGYNGIVELGFNVTKDVGKIIVELNHVEIPVLLQRLDELEKKCLEYKIIIYWGHTNGCTEFQTKNWDNCI